MTQRSTQIFIIFYALCFLFGSLGHWLDIYYHGFLPYRTIPLAFNIYLTSLAVFDLMVVLLLFTRPILGIIVAIVIMTSDLIIDFYVAYTCWHTTLATNIALQLLLIFSLFLFISAPFVIASLRIHKI